MKTSFLPQLFARHPRRIATVGCCLAALLISVRSVPAAALWQQQAGTNSYNFYDEDGLSGNYDGLDPDPGGTLGGEPMSYLNFFTNPPYTVSGTIPPTGPVNITGPATGATASFTLGNNPTGAGTITLTLSNPNSVPDVVRLDWSAVYNNISGGPISILGFAANISGSDNIYYALAGGETIYYQGNPYTATIDNSYTHAGLGAGPWYGANASGAFSVSPTALFSPYPIVASGASIAVKGYLCLVVDPGTVQVQIEALQPPTVGICIYSNSPVVFFPATPGTNYTLQMTTNLASTNWVTVTNGVPFSGVEITNAPNPAFFRLQ